MSILFTNAAVVTMDPENPVLKDAFVAVEGTKIASVGTERPQGTFDRTIDCTGKVLMPGLVNAHTHVPMTAGATTSSTGSTTGFSPPRPSWTTGAWPPGRRWAWPR